jgi:hypothetical protein
MNEGPVVGRRYKSTDTSLYPPGTIHTLKLWSVAAYQYSSDDPRFLCTFEVQIPAWWQKNSFDKIEHVYHRRSDFHLDWEALPYDDV